MIRPKSLVQQRTASPRTVIGMRNHREWDNQMAVSLSQTYTSVVILSGAVDNPATIGSAALLQDGLYTDSLGAAWTITNAGGVLGAGITLQSVGTVVSSGSIAGGGTGIDLLAGGYVGNLTGATIAGGAGAFDSSSGSGDIGGDGVDLAGAATLSNGGTIIAGIGGSTEFTSGAIADGGAGGTGIHTTTGANLTNGGTVSGGAGGGGGFTEYAGNGGTGGGGVWLATGGSLTNTGTIAGGYGGGGGLAGDALGANPPGISNPGAFGGAGGVGVYLAAAASMANAGAITGGRGGEGGAVERSDFGAAGVSGNGAAAVSLAADAVLTNTGVISGGSGGSGASSPSALVGGSGANAGDGINLAAGGTVINKATISGGSGGAGAGDERGGAGGSGGWGISLAGSGLITNTGTIAGGSGGASGGGFIGSEDPGSGGGGVAIGGGTLVTSGTISGNAGAEAVSFGNLAATLVIDPGAAFYGAVAGNPNALDTMELGGSAAGSLSGIGSQFLDFTRIAVDAGASWTLDGSLTGAGTVTIGGDSTLELTGSVSSQQTITVGGGSLFAIDPEVFSGTIDGFTIGDTIGLTGVTDGVSPQIVNGNTLEVQRSGHASVDLTLDPNVSYAGDLYAVTAVGAVTQEAPCFLRGTLIRTERGDIAVEALTTADRVVTLSGRSRPITWIGTGEVLVSPGKRCAATPIIVRKGAMAENVPHVDLHITKGHALFVDGVLIPAEFLVNHRSILWDDLRKTVAFYHVELDGHDVLLANGTPAESYRDDGNRWLFQNANAGWEQPPKPPCAPVLTGGPVVDAIWRRLLDRAGSRPSIQLTSDPDLHLVVDEQRVDAKSRTDSVLVFAVPNRHAAVRIVSLAGTPQELGLSRDPRCLGIALRSLIVRRNTQFQVIKAIDKRLAAGFHTFERDTGLRWTDGDAPLPNALFQGFDGPFELVLQLGGATRYPAFIGTADRTAA